MIIRFCCHDVDKTVYQSKDQYCSGSTADEQFCVCHADEQKGTIVKRQLQIQQDELRIETDKFLYDIGKIFCTGDIISPGTEILFQKVCDDLIVFDDKNTVHGRSFLLKF